MLYVYYLVVGSPYNMGGGTPGGGGRGMMSPGPNTTTDSMGYNMTLNGSEYNSPQVWAI